MQEHAMNGNRTVRFQGDGLALNALDYGGAGRTPLLFLHGGSAHAHWWDFVAPGFAPDFHAIAIDQRGHGESGRPVDWAYGSRHYLADLDRVIDQLSPGRPILVGHSMGAHNALLYASDHSQRLKGIVIIDTRPEYPQTSVDFLRGLAEKKPPRYPTLEEAVAAFRLLPRETLAEKEVLDHVARHTFTRDAGGKWVHKLDRRTLIREPLSVWEGLGRIACPALIVRVPLSPLLSRENALKMAAMIPHGRCAEIERAYHHVMLDNPRELTAELRSFLKEIP